MPEPFAFHDLPASAFPLTAELLDTTTGTPVWSAVIDGPGAFRVPSRDEVNDGRPVSVRLTFPDGQVVAGP